MDKSSISQIRNDYKKQKLRKEDLDKDPIRQFQIWLDEAIKSELTEPTAMTLATADATGKPSARIVLLKSIDQNGFAFFTNYESKKGIELKQNPKAALVFYWSQLERQVRVEGTVSKLNRAISEEYFNSRPKESRISTIISPQSTPIPNRTFLEKRVEKFLKDRREIKIPDNWGGYILTPGTIEFWQGRENRLHDRFLYTRKNNDWEIVRLAP
ncbi:pyridoxamine 5'-phosphate oxidase [hydrocarbon metagenome]|uniref:Pyridoxamine 5'-phosphate oxidase n=1 Tax=hydrocarbon metagenome TaxID=938273 RepID=A0A0W8FV03_9ZZZZ